MKARRPLRIIAGEHRRRLLRGPADYATTRPITDRVKQALFDRLETRAMLDGGHVLDIFCGTGTLGLEALSRGCDQCTFIEKDRTARALLEENIAELNETARSTVLGVDALHAGWLRTLPPPPVSLVFLDPPYPMTQDARGMSRVEALITQLADVCEPLAVCVLRTEEHTAAQPAPGWDGPLAMNFGSMTLHFFVRLDDDASSEQRQAQDAQ